MKKIKAPLRLGNGKSAHNMEDLRCNFNLIELLERYADGKLFTWLEDRYYEKELADIKALDVNSADFAVRLCEILGVDAPAHAEVSMQAMIAQNTRLEKLKLITDDDEILQDLNSVVFSQNELTARLEKKPNKVYLYQGTYQIYNPKLLINFIGIGDVSLNCVDFKEGEMCNICVDNVTFFINGAPASEVLLYTGCRYVKPLNAPVDECIVLSIDIEKNISALFCISDAGERVQITETSENVQWFARCEGIVLYGDSNSNQAILRYIDGSHRQVIHSDMQALHIPQSGLTLSQKYFAWISEGNAFALALHSGTVIPVESPSFEPSGKGEHITSLYFSGNAVLSLIAGNSLYKRNLSTDNSVKIGDISLLPDQATVSQKAPDPNSPFYNADLAWQKLRNMSSERDARFGSLREWTSYLVGQYTDNYVLLQIHVLDRTVRTWCAHYRYATWNETTQALTTFPEFGSYHGFQINARQMQGPFVIYEWCDSSSQSPKTSTTKVECLDTRSGKLSTLSSFRWGTGRIAANDSWIYIYKHLDDFGNRVTSIYRTKFDGSETELVMKEC